jgi:DNA processing protein
VDDGLRDLEERSVVAIVGARSPSPYGGEMTRLIARDLTDAGVLVISGMALGIDAIAQTEAVAAASRRGPGLDAAADDGPCSTVAVLGCGIDITYPRENARLADRIARTGLLLSEFPGQVPARPWRFPCRNRVIAGLARAVVVVEGSERSGSLLTAAFAADLGRDVLAVPGEAGRRLSAGPHKLLRRGAHLCESAGDVLEAIGLRQAAWSRKRAAGPAVTGPLGRVLSELDSGERTVDELAAALRGGAAEVAALLAGLEVDGLVARAESGRYRLCRR